MPRMSFLDLGWSLNERRGSSANSVSFTVSVNSFRRFCLGGTPTLWTYGLSEAWASSVEWTIEGIWQNSPAVQKNKKKLLKDDEIAQTYALKQMHSFLEYLSVLWKSECIYAPFFQFTNIDMCTVTSWEVDKILLSSLYSNGKHISIKCINCVNR